MSSAAIILAAGKGTRMKSDLPKGLHCVGGLPLVEHVGRAAKAAGIKRPTIVVGHGGEQMIETLGNGYDYVWQREQHGTGHAVMQASDLLQSHKGPVLILPGDTPLLTAEVLTKLLDHHSGHNAICTVATAMVQDPTGYGRIVRDAKGGVRKIVEHKDASAEERAINEVNAAVYVFDAHELNRVLPTLSNKNAQGEYYLTDVLEIFINEGKKVEAVAFEDEGLLKGINDRWQLAEADKLLRKRILKKHALDGVTIVDPDTVYIEADVQIGRDTVIEPGVHLRGSTKLGERCWIGPYTHVLDCTLGDDCNILMSHMKGARLHNRVKIGPFANIRPGTVLEDGVKIGNFVEVKNAHLQSKVAASHLTYIGDAAIGAETNIGAGTITCNYDGFSKHRTEIGTNVFVGSNSTLIAPLKIGDGAMIAAGSVISHEVPADALGLGRARQENKEEWVAQWRKRRSK